MPDQPSFPRPRITAILNCYGESGANRSQIVLRADGSAEILGEERSMAKTALLALRNVDLRRLRGVPLTPTV